MGDLYASAIGTTVLQLKEIPECPPAFKGALYVSSVFKGVDGAKLQAELKAFGSIEKGGCALHSPLQTGAESGVSSAQQAGTLPTVGGCQACGKRLTEKETEWGMKEGYTASCDECYDASRCRYAIVKFATHAEAIQAEKADATALGLGRFFALRYNERRYDERGW